MVWEWDRDRERELGGQASRGEATLGRKQHQRGSCEPASAQASFKHLGWGTNTNNWSWGRGGTPGSDMERGLARPLAVCRAQVQSLSRRTVEAEPCGQEQRQSGVGPTSHTPSYHIWQKLMFSKFKDLISERAEEAHGEWWPRRAPVQLALELWVLGWHIAAVMALGVPRLVPL